ncbi:putative Neuronal acetylcholine receptor subunit alpha-2 [Hypsibius exemplaris]|uniref:Neuronal acetylcholine receptor subunit alpha-2 n=1 Tax=Hypsibius exemplaris TaxID=2072580 RepID=A0A1W0WX77_HYPEX|nr:putative Neuronal acetylcholine receptor subunit alpha-2 [Hypsibius exemplaris]
MRMSLLAIAGSGYAHSHSHSHIASALESNIRAAADAHVRPNADQSGSPTVVSVGLSIFGLEQTQLRKDTLTANGYISFAWNDPRLAWSPAYYGNLTQIPVSASALWIPDITLYNSADASLPLASTEQKLALVMSNGDVMWIPKTRFSFAYNKTEVDGKHKLNATLKFGSWVYSDQDLDIQPKDPEVLNDMYESTEFTLLNSTFTRQLIFYSCCPEGYPRLDVSLTIEKKN